MQANAGHTGGSDIAGSAVLAPHQDDRRAYPSNRIDLACVV